MIRQLPTDAYREIALAVSTEMSCCIVGCSCMLMPVLTFGGGLSVMFGYGALS